MSTDDSLLEHTARQAFTYFEAHVNPQNGLIADSSRAHSPASIAATGMALSLYPIACERGWWQRSHAADVTLKTLRFFADSPQNEKPRTRREIADFTIIFSIGRAASAPGNRS